MKLLKNAFLRGGFLVIIMTAISLYMKHDGFDAQQVKSTFLVGLIVGSVAAASVIYDIDEWPLKKRSIVHFVIMLLTVFPCLLFSGWFPLNNVLDFFKILGVFLLVGLVLWTIFYFIFGKRFK